jgi:ketosteroid isomerase-like protein
MDRATEAVVSGNLDALRELYSPDVVASTPDAGTVHGIEAFIEWNRGFVDAFSERAYLPDRGFETEDCAIDQGYFSGTHTKPLQLAEGQSVPPTGKQIRLRAMDVATVADGKIVRHDFYYDTLDMLTQLGLMEAATPTTTT